MNDFSDQALTLAAIAPFADAPVRIEGIGHIRGQECDRIHAIQTNLTALGIRCEEEETAATIYPEQPHGGSVRHTTITAWRWHFPWSDLEPTGLSLRTRRAAARRLKIILPC